MWLLYLAELGGAPIRRRLGMAMILRRRTMTLVRIFGNCLSSLNRSSLELIALREGFRSKRITLALDCRPTRW